MFAVLGRGAGIPIERLRTLSRHTHHIPRRGTGSVNDSCHVLERLAAGPGTVNGIVMLASATPGDAAVRIRDWASCDGSFSRTCDPNIDEPLQQYESSTDPPERDRSIKQVQQYILDNRVFVSIFRNAFIVGQGPRIANNWEEILGATPQYVYVAPYEDVRLKE